MAETGRRAGPATAEPTGGGAATAPHTAEDTSFHRALYPSGDSAELPPPADRGTDRHWQTVTPMS